MMKEGEKRKGREREVEGMGRREREQSGGGPVIFTRFKWGG